VASTLDEGNSPISITIPPGITTINASELSVSNNHPIFINYTGGASVQITR